MHIPDAMLQGKVCPVTAIVSTVGLIAAAWGCMKSKNSPSAGRFGAISALIFAAQMLNFPVMNGTSGHLVGGVLAAGLLGIPFGVLSMALVITIQSLVFADGGITVLGANIVNMALVGAGAGGLLRHWFSSKWHGKRGDLLATALGAWCAVQLAALCASIELAADGQIAFSLVFPSMLYAHALIGLGESMITLFLFSLFSSPASSPNRYSLVITPLVTAALIALLLSPFASSYPGGLEWVADKYSFLHATQPTIEGLFPNYSVSSISNSMVSTSLAGFAGVLMTFGVAWLLRAMLSGVKTA